MNQHQTSDITQAVLDRLGDDTDPRFREIITGVVRHAHALVRELDLKPDEWMNAIQFLTKVGQTCDAKRQEFILLSDTLGISMLVVQLDQARRSRDLKGATEATVQGPFYWEGAPVLALGSDIGQGMPGAVSASQVRLGELMLEVPADKLLGLLEFLRDDPKCLFKQLIDICGVDWPDRKKRFDVVYNLLSLKNNQRIRVKVQTDEATPVPSAAPI